MRLETKKFMELNKFERLTRVQEDVLKEVNRKNDLIVLAPTGTGKTHSFLFSILETLDIENQSLQAVILAPTRELAMQTHDFSKFLTQVNENIKIELAIGGMDNSRLEKSLKNDPHILISTPGKLKDVIERNMVRLDFVELLIIDEMDMMFDYGFIEEINEIASRFLNKTRFMLFSATLPQGLNQFISKYLHNPIQIKSEDKTFQPKINHILVHRRHQELEEAVLDVVSAINPSVAIIFANTKDQVGNISRYLREYGIETVEIHGGLNDRLRTQVVRQIRSGHIRYIVATDLAARGIDLPEISHVINANIPTHDLSFYTHRAGRTGRTGRDGMAISLVDDQDQNAISRLMNQNINFSFKRIRNGELVDARPFVNFERRGKQVDPEIAAKLRRKKVKVKPGYKKKHKAKIDKLMKDKRREFIKQDIRRQKKERAIDRQRRLKDD